MKNGCTTLGPHRDDLDLWVDGVAVRCTRFRSAMVRWYLGITWEMAPSRKARRWLGPSRTRERPAGGKTPAKNFPVSSPVNVIYGENAQGKTNLVEALYLLTGQKSFLSFKTGLQAVS